VTQHEEQKVRNGSTAEEHPADDSEEICRTQSEIPDRSFSLYIQSLQKSGKDTKTTETSSEIISHFEVVEKVMEAADNWSGKASSFLDFYHDGIYCQERLEKAEVNVQALTQLLHRQEDVQSSDFDRWRHKVVRTRERVQ
ncbi:unnamed protein product, partial [Ranitomeya imitator]